MIIVIMKVKYGTKSDIMTKISTSTHNYYIYFKNKSIYYIVNLTSVCLYDKRLKKLQKIFYVKFYAKE